MTDSPLVSASPTLLPRRPWVLAAALAGFALVLGLRFLRSGTADGITILYIVPIIVLAIEFGRTAGLAGGLTALGLFAFWDVVDEQDVSLLGYVTRGIAFLFVGWLTGRMAERLRASATD